MEEKTSFEHLSKMVALMNKHGLDVDWMKYGYSLIKNTPADELKQLEAEISSFKQFVSEKRSINHENKATTHSDKIVRGYADGCYDLMHAGHYNSIRQSKKLWDVLVWGVNSDEEIAAVKGPTVLKGPEREVIFTFGELEFNQIMQ